MTHYKDVMKNITESESYYHDLEKMSVIDLLESINNEDQKVAIAVKKSIPDLENLISVVVDRLKKGGRLFYLGAGTSGRLGILDASECPPTFGVSHDMVIGIIAGGDTAIRKAVEFAEDDTEAGWIDLCAFQISQKDVLIGIAASGTTPYVIGAIKKCNEEGILTAGISCNPGSQLALLPVHPIVVEVGPEFVSGSTRMKSGTAQKMILNMLSTAVMIRMGRVKGNKMVDMKLSNQKLVKRGVQMLMDSLSIEEKQASELIEKYGSVRKAISSTKNI